MTPTSGTRRSENFGLTTPAESFSANAPPALQVQADQRRQPLLQASEASQAGVPAGPLAADHGIREHRDRLMFDAALDAVIDMDEQGSITGWNKRAEEIFGWSGQEVAGRRMRDIIIPPAYREAHEQGLRRFLATGEGPMLNRRMEMTALHRDGREFAVELMVTPLKLRQKWSFTAVVRDVSEQKRTESALRDSEAKLRVTLDQIPAIFWTTDTQLRITSLLGAGLARLNLKQNEKAGGNLFEVMPDAGDLHAAAHARALKGEAVSYELDWQGAHYDARVQPLRDTRGVVAGCVGLAVDVTQQKQTEHALTESEERFRLLVEGVKDYAILMLDPKGHILSWNSGAERITGHRSEDIVGQHFSIFYPIEDVRAGEPERALKIAAAEGRFEHQSWRVCKDGSRFWGDVVLTALRDKNGDLQGFSKITRDVTERKNAEEQLRDSEFKFRSITESASQAIITGDSAGNICFWNRGAERMFGYTDGEILGKPVTLLLPPRYRTACEGGIDRLRAGRALQVLGKMIEVHAVRKGGAEFPVELSISAWQAGPDTFYTGIISDVSVRKQAEDSLRQLSSLLLRLQDEERRRLARELHDSTAQTLSALSLSLALVNQCGALAEYPDGSKALTESISLADQACQEIRTFSYLLHPPLLDEAGLAEALRWYTDGFAQRTKIQVNLSILPATLGRLPRDIEMALFRVAQESLTNVYRHSGSAVAGVRLTQDGEEVRLEIWDEGKGLPEETLGPWNAGMAKLGVGIVGMRERVRQLGGRLQLRPGSPGARVEVVLPLDMGIDGEPNPPVAAEPAAHGQNVKPPQT